MYSVGSSPSVQMSGIGPGSGNQPNGVYYLATTVTVPQDGTVTLSVAADDAAAVYFGGALIAQVNLLQSSTYGAQAQFSGNIKAGTYVVAVEVSNNDNGTYSYVPYNSGSANPTAFLMTIAQNGQTLRDTSSATGWVMLAYPSQQLSPSPIPAYSSSGMGSPYGNNPNAAPTDCPTGSAPVFQTGYGWTCAQQGTPTQQFTNELGAIESQANASGDAISQYGYDLSGSGSNALADAEAAAQQFANQYGGIWAVYKQTNASGQVAYQVLSAAQHAQLMAVPGAVIGTWIATFTPQSSPATSSGSSSQSSSTASQQAAQQAAQAAAAAAAAQQQQELAALQSQINSAQSTLAGLNGTVNTLTAQLNSLKSQGQQYQSQLSSELSQLHNLQAQGY